MKNKYESKSNNVNTLRLSDNVSKSIYLISKEENLTKSDAIRMLLEKSIKDYYLNKALSLYEKEEVDFSTATEISKLSVRDFLEELKKAGICLNVPLEMSDLGFKNLIDSFPLKKNKK